MARVMKADICLYPKPNKFIYYKQYKLERLIIGDINKKIDKG